MNAADLNTIIGTTAAFAIGIGAGIKWLLLYIDAQQTKGELAESVARTALSNHLHEEIRMLRVELSAAQADKQLYLRRIFQLEFFINKNNLKIPEMDGWPPSS